MARGRGVARVRARGIVNLLLRKARGRVCIFRPTLPNPLASNSQFPTAQWSLRRRRCIVRKQSSVRLDLSPMRAEKGGI